MFCEMMLVMQLFTYKIHALVVTVKYFYILDNTLTTPKEIVFYCDVSFFQLKCAKNRMECMYYSNIHTCYVLLVFCRQSLKYDIIKIVLFVSCQECEVHMFLVVYVQVSLCIDVFFCSTTLLT